MKKRMLAMMMAIVMVMTLLPTSALAADGVGEPSETNSGAVFSKTVHQENNGDVKITLEAWATGQTVQTTKQQPLDIVLVLDQSGSMANNFDKKTSRQAAMKNAVNGFIDKVAKNYTEGAAHRISIVTFGSEAKVLQNWTKVDANGTDDLKNKVSGLPETPAGATNVAEGMTKAQTQLSNAQKDHKKVVVVFTDGVPTTHSDFSTKVATNAIETAKALKDNQTEIYTIGIFNGVNANQLYGEKWAYLFYKDVPCTGEVGSYWGGSSAASLFGGNDFADIDVAAGNRFLNYLSSNFAEVTSIGVERGRYDPSNTLVDGTGYKITQNFDRFSSDYYLTATDSASLNNVFTQISQNINSAVNEKLDTTAVVKDTMTEYFNLPDNTTGIKVYTQNRQADGNWADRVETTDTTVKIDGQTVTVTGYDYATNFVSETAKADGSYGQKLVIEFTITPDLAKLAQDEAVKVDTNTGAGLYLGETAVAKGESGKASFCGVKYDANGGKGTVPATEIGANGKKFNVPASCDTLKKDKAVLLGFSATKREALVTSENDATGVVTEYTPANNTLDTLYAVWAEDENGNGTPDYKEDKYTITYAAGTEDTTVSGIPAKVDNVLAGTEQTVSSAQPTRKGYTFSGWTTTDVEVKNDKTFTMPKTNVTFTAQWTANDVTITFDANGGKWAEGANVADYTLIDHNTKASKTYKPSEAVAKIATDPVRNGKTFNGWYVKIPGKTGEEPEKYFITVWNAALQAQRIQEYGGVIYADWTGAAPAGQCTYTTRQHYIDEKGKEVATVDVGGADLLALQGTKISDLIKHLETDQNYFGQKYLYDGTKTTVNNAAYKADTMTLDTKGTAIDLYYYLDEWNDEDDTLTGGDGTPDKYQALVKFESADANKGTVTGTGAVQVFTFKDAAGKYLASGNVTPSLDNVTTTPATGFVFDYWTKDNGTDSVDPATTMENVPGGTTIIFKANWKSNIVTITFDANGGAWAADVAGYTMNADKTTASKKFNLSDTVEKITPDPVQDGKKFSGWGVKLDENGKPSDKIVAYPLVETSATAAAHKRIFDEKPIIFYAMWEDAAQPTEKLNYTIHQHYIGSNGKQDAQFNDELPKTASAGTKISDLIPAELQKNRKYYYQTYIYLSSETKIVNDNVATPVADDTVLNKDNTQIHLYYYLDAWNDENNTLTGGDNIPDKYQAVVTYKVVGGTWKDGKTDDQVQVFTLKTKNKETGVWEDVTPAPTLGNTIPTGMISSYSRTASQSWDKDITKDTKVTESVTYTYTFTKGSSGGGGGSSSTHYYISLKKVDAQDGEALSGAKFGLYLDGKQIATATSDRNGIVRFSMGSSNYRSLTDKSNLYCQELTAPEGYKLSNEKIAVSKKNVSTSSSTSDKNAKTVKNSRSKTPSMLNGEDHFAYIVGYPDKTVHPQSSITRAEVATIFFRLLTEETRTANATKTNNYADVSSDNWYNQAVSTLSAMGIIKGDSRGNFNPNAPITRAEFAAIAARFDKTEDVAAASFGDVAMHWAKPEISVAANNGWINGYTDGTFHPDSKITRAEAMVMINRVLQRLPESKADLLDGMIQWSDNADTSKWYYLAVQEATNSHYYELKANQHEKWTKLRENRDWTQLEK